MYIKKRSEDIFASSHSGKHKNLPVSEDCQEPEIGQIILRQFKNLKSLIYFKTKVVVVVGGCIF